MKYDCDKTVECQLEKLQCVIEKLVAAGKLPGISLGICLCDNVIYQESFGRKSENPMDLIDNDTIFQLGGVSLSFLATWFSQLNGEGTLCFDQKIFRLGDVRYLGQDLAFQATIANSLSSQVQLGLLKAIMSVLLLVQNLPTTALFQVIKWEATNPVQEPWNMYSFFFGSYRNEYVAPAVMAVRAASFLGVNLITTLEALWASIGLTTALYGKAAFEANPNRALPLVWVNGMWKASYIFDPAFAESSLGLSINITDLTSYMKFILKKGLLDNTQVINGSSIEEMLEGSSRDLLPPDSNAARNLINMMNKNYLPICNQNRPGGGDWYNTKGWKVRYYRGHKLHYSVGFLETGGNNLIMMSQCERFGISILTNSLTPYPYAIAILAYYLIVLNDTNQGFDEFEKSFDRVDNYIELKSVDNKCSPPTPCHCTISPIGNWWADYGGLLQVFESGGDIMFKWRDYDAVVGQNIGQNFWRFFYTDFNGIERFMQLNFTFDAEGNAYNVAGVTFSGSIDFKLIPPNSNPCALNDASSGSCCDPCIKCCNPCGYSSGSRYRKHPDINDNECPTICIPITPCSPCSTKKCKKKCKKCKYSPCKCYSKSYSSGYVSGDSMLIPV